MNIKENLPLKDLTTFRIGGPAKFFIEANNREKLQEAVSFANEKKLPILIMGGGSNMLVSDRGFNGVVICPNFLGFEISGERVKIGAGENWDECVKRIIDAGLWGVENLSFIPGNAAGMAVQNAGAYGQEAANVIESVDIYDVISNFQFPISNEKCGFGYRKSIFNTTEKGKYVVLGLTLKLSKNGKPNTSYGLKQGTLSEMREQIIKIRKSKGQNPLKYKSAGSFFKNPVITEEQYAKLEPKPPKFPVQKPCPTPPSIEGGEQRGFVKTNHSAPHAPPCHTSAALRGPWERVPGSQKNISTDILGNYSGG